MRKGKKRETRAEKAAREAMDLTKILEQVAPSIEGECASKQLFSVMNDVAVSNEEMEKIKEKGFDKWTDEDLCRLIAIINKYMNGSGEGAGTCVLVYNIIYNEIPVAVENGAVQPFPTMITREFIEWARNTYEWFNYNWVHICAREEYKIAEFALSKRLNEGAAKMYLSSKYGWAERSEKLVRADVNATQGILSIDPFEEVK